MASGSKIFCAVVVAGGVLWVSGCSSVRPKPVSVRLQEDPAKIASRVSEVREVITQKADLIKTTAEKIKDETRKTAPTASEKAQEIKTQAESIKEASNRLSPAEKSILKLRVQLLDLNKEKAELLEELEKYRKGYKQSQEKIWLIVLGFSAICIVGGMFCFVGGRAGMGVSLLGAGVGSAAFAYFFLQFAWLVPLVGGVIFLLVLGILLYHVLTSTKVTEELIAAFHFVKTRQWTPKTKKIVEEAQSKQTRKYIEKVQKKKPIVKLAEP